MDLNGGGQPIVEEEGWVVADVAVGGGEREENVAKGDEAVKYSGGLSPE